MTPYNFLNSFINTQLGSTLADIFFPLKKVFIVLDIILFFWLIFVFIQSWEYHPKFVMNPRKQTAGKRILTLKDAVLKEKWEAIMKKSQMSLPQSLTLAIIECDSFVDSVLKRMGLEGEHMADRLEKLDPEEIKTLPRLWNAHRTRNDLVHTPGFTISMEQAKRILNIYEEFLKEIQLL